jgi:biotin transport system substrate-specific component
LGKGYGSLSQLFYVLLGIAGIPWFAVGPIGPTGGYLVGFIVAPYLIGFLRERFERPAGIRDRGGSAKYPAGMPLTLMALFAGVALIYGFGLIQFSIFTRRPPLYGIRYAVLPFIPFDLGKAFLAALTVRMLKK